MDTPSVQSLAALQPRITLPTFILDRSRSDSVRTAFERKWDRLCASVIVCATFHIATITWRWIVERLLTKAIIIYLSLWTGTVQWQISAFCGYMCTYLWCCYCQCVSDIFMKTRIILKCWFNNAPLTQSRIVKLGRTEFIS